MCKAGNLIPARQPAHGEKDVGMVRKMRCRCGRDLESHHLVLFCPKCQKIAADCECEMTVEKETAQALARFYTEE